jgi:hypothetical protein
MSWTETPGVASPVTSQPLYQRAITRERVPSARGVPTKQLHLDVAFAPRWRFSPFSEPPLVSPLARIAARPWS